MGCNNTKDTQDQSDAQNESKLNLDITDCKQLQSVYSEQYNNLNLKLQNLDLDDRFVVEIKGFFQKVQFKRLDINLQNNNLGEIGIRCLFHEINSKINDIKQLKIDISNNIKATDVSTILVTKIQQKNDDLIDFTLNVSNIAIEQSDLIAKFFGSNSHFQRISLIMSNCQISNPCFRKFFVSYYYKKDLLMNSFTQSIDQSCIISNSYSNTELKYLKLDFSNNKIGDDFLDVLLEKLFQFKQLQEFDFNLKNNFNITDFGAQKIIDGIVQCKKLKTLNLNLQETLVSKDYGNTMENDLKNCLKSIKKIDILI